jgi:hypothetical protein
MFACSITFLHFAISEAIDRLMKISAQPATAAPVLLPRSLAEVKKRHPNMTVLVREGTVETLLPDRKSGGDGTAPHIEAHRASLEFTTRQSGFVSASGA